jgi:alkanesulfonate monooxygenase SsuD/methylene tetrahydromethanopterin reductase-like flavin-dependent oxidoreductase (luciferase family)
MNGTDARQELGDDAQILFFSEMGYNVYPIEALEEYGYSALLFPNSIFDREKARDLWQMFLREHEYASEMGFDGSVCNEHHNNVLSMQESVNISAAVISQRIRGTIALIGNPLPIHDNPVRVAEEIAMLDLISGGRIISGFVRGTGLEQLSTNANPAYNRERFEEAFALIKRPGPCPALSAGKASTITCASSTRGNCHCRSRTRRSGQPAS